MFIMSTAADAVEKAHDHNMIAAEIVPVVATALCHHHSTNP
jgi:hypothetical protein